MFTRDRFIQAAKAYSQHKAASRAKVDQLRAAVKESNRNLHECEYLRLRREYHEAKDRAITAERRHDAELQKLAAEIVRLNPASELIAQLETQAVAQAERLRNDYPEPISRFMSEEEIAAAAAHAERRNAQLSAWVSIRQRLQDIRSSVTPFTDIRELLDQHADVLPELSYVSFEIPECESELAYVD